MDGRVRPPAEHPSVDNPASPAGPVQKRTPMTALPHACERETPGNLMAIGGAEDTLRDRVILNRFMDLAGGSDARIAIIPTASQRRDTGERYQQVFLDMGAQDATVAAVQDRQTAIDGGMADLVENATGIFLTGGSQMRLCTILAGTPLEQALRKSHASGVPVAGTSAGASYLSTHMVGFGSGGPTPRRRMAQMTAGLGLADGLIIDQHFRQRDRLGRLLMFIAENPGLLGIGVDEDTAALIRPDQVLEVVGRNSVTIVDGSGSYSDADQVKGSGRLTISGAIVHVLPAGRKFDLGSRTLIQPTK